MYSYDENEHNKVTLSNESYSKTINGIALLKNKGIKYRVARVIIKNVNLCNKNTDLFTLSKNRDLVRLTGRASLSLYDREMLLKKIITKRTFNKSINKDLVISNLSGNSCFSSKIYIASNFDVFPCVMERRIKHGNLKNNRLADIIKRDILFLNKDVVKECKKCEFRYTCKDCRPDSLNSDVYSKPWYCTYNPNIGKWENEYEFIERILKK